jgi:hypothetical protein
MELHLKQKFERPGENVSELALTRLHGKRKNGPSGVSPVQSFHAELMAAKCSLEAEIVYWLQACYRKSDRRVSNTPVFLMDVIEVRNER